MDIRLIRCRVNRTLWTLVLIIFCGFLLMVTLQKRIGNQSDIQSLRNEEKKRQVALTTPEGAILNGKLHEPKNEPKIKAKSLIYEKPAAVNPVFKCIPMPTGRGDTPVCVYDVRIDKFVSKTLLNHERWEESTCKYMEKLFDSYEDLHLIDLGANVGVYSLTALKYGRRVVAVDPNEENLKRIRTAAHRGKFPFDWLVLVKNAVSDKRERIQLKPNVINVGGRGIMPASSDKDSVDAILMDDLLDVVPFTKAILKMDIETAEARALSHARNMFDKIDIPIVFMEWIYAKVEPGGRNMRTFFEERGYMAFENPINGSSLLGDHQKWPMDIYWVRTKDAKFPAIKNIRIQ